MLGFDAVVLATFSLAASRLPAVDFPQAFRVLAVALVPASRLVLASASFAKAGPRARSPRSGQTAVSLQYRGGCPREVRTPKGKLGENVLTFSSGVIKTRTRRLPASLSSSREQDREINGLIDAPGTRTPSAAHQTIESAAGSEIGPTPLLWHPARSSPLNPPHFTRDDFFWFFPATPQTFLAVCRYVVLVIYRSAEDPIHEPRHQLAPL